MTFPQPEAVPTPFPPGSPDGPPLQPLPASWGEPVLDPFGQREPVVYVLDAYGRSVPMLKAHYQPQTDPTPPRDLEPRGVDPKAQRLAAGGVLAAGAGWGVGEAVNAAAGLGTGSLIALAALVVAWKVGPAIGRKTVNHVTNTTTLNVNATNTSRWFGRSTTTSTTHTTNTHR